MLWPHIKIPTARWLSSTYELLIDMYESALAKHKATVTTNSVPDIIHLLYSEICKESTKYEKEPICVRPYLYQITDYLSKKIKKTLKRVHLIFAGNWYGD